MELTLLLYSREQQEAALEADDEDGTFVNYELEVGYHARPGMNIKNHNIRWAEPIRVWMHVTDHLSSLLLELFMSMKDLFKFVALMHLVARANPTK